jgi:hypothetical protein
MEGYKPAKSDFMFDGIYFLHLNRNKLFVDSPPNAVICRTPPPRIYLFAFYLVKFLKYKFIIFIIHRGWLMLMVVDMEVEQGRLLLLL